MDSIVQGRVWKDERLGEKQTEGEANALAQGVVSDVEAKRSAAHPLLSHRHTVGCGFGDG